MRATTAVSSVLIATAQDAIRPAAAEAVLVLMGLDRDFARQGVEDYLARAADIPVDATVDQTTQAAARAWAVVERVALKLEGQQRG